MSICIAHICKQTFKALVSNCYL